LHSSESHTPVATLSSYIHVSVEMTAVREAVVASSFCRFDLFNVSLIGRQLFPPHGVASAYRGLRCDKIIRQSPLAFSLMHQRLVIPSRLSHRRLSRGVAFVRLREVLGLNLDWGTSFSSVPPGKFMDNSEIESHPFPSKSFKFHHSSVILSTADGDVK
jgi:hypothetical protein